MATRISSAAASGRLKASVDFVVGLLDAGAGPGYLEIRTGTQPASVATAASGTLMATLTLSDPAFGAATDASPSVATANAVSDDPEADADADPDGDAWFRAYDSDGNGVLDGAVGESGSAAELILNSVSVVAGNPVSVSSFTYTQAST